MVLGVARQRWVLIGLLLVAGLAVFVADPGGGLVGRCAGMALMVAALLALGLGARGGKRQPAASAAGARPILQRTCNVGCRGRGAAVTRPVGS
jgi:hypothetical protein